VEPANWYFGTLNPGITSSVDLTIQNSGDTPLTITGLLYEQTSDELTLDLYERRHGELPWTLGVGDSKKVRVHYAPSDDTPDTGTLRVTTSGPPPLKAESTQSGNGRLDEVFYTGWYVHDDGIVYETTSNPDHQVDHHGDHDLYWYEPSGVHGLIDSVDPVNDFATMRQHVLAHDDTPFVATGPFSWEAQSELSTYREATFAYFMCDFYLDPDDDPALYEIKSGRVDDGIQVMVNGAILGRLKLWESGRWPLSEAKPGEVNTLIIILVDDSRSERYVNGLAFYRDGVMVQG